MSVVCGRGQLGTKRMIYTTRLVAGRSIEHSAIALAQMQFQDTYRSGVFLFKFAYLDPENAVSLTFANRATTSFTAQDLLRGATVNAQSYRVSFDTGGGAAISKVVLYNNKSNQSGDEPQTEDGGNGTSLFFIDSITGAVPGPATWSLMILGFGLVGASLRSGRRSKLPAAT